jgi:hypothetical protein
MNPRFQFDESVSDEPLALHFESSSPPAIPRHLLDVDWENANAEPLMLYVSDEPRVGLEFSYHGLEWRIVEYDDGWIAKLLVE